MNVEDLEGKTIALAASGGLDSCTVTRWLVEHEPSLVEAYAAVGRLTVDVARRKGTLDADRAGQIMALFDSLEKH